MPCPAPLLRFARLTAACLLTSAIPVAAAEHQDFQVLRQAAGRWLEAQAATAYPETLSRADVGGVDERLRLAACPSPQFFLPAGGRLWGGGTLGIRCAEPRKWSLYVSFQNHVQGPALVTTRPLPARAVPGPGDLELRQIEFEYAPDRYPREWPGEARLIQALPAGKPLLIDYLDMPEVVQVGHAVRVVASGTGFSVAQMGTALNSAAPGQGVRVKMASGRIVQGIATAEGHVAISP